ncbi:hypothetical protein [Sphingomonas sp. ID0503]|uniref:hypothetical protein n=1 Tax=Sphingomonas sp. ID0503 TaxID=3399691 RepID=UPI003AFB4951
MTDASHADFDRSEDTSADLPSFTPAVTRARHDGWTADRQRVFIAVLAETGCVTDAADAAGVSPRSAYRLRARLDAADFAFAWDHALRQASNRLVSAAFEGAIHGRTQQIWKKGELAVQSRTPSDRLLIFLIKHLDPNRFTHPSHSKINDRLRAPEYLASRQAKLVDLPLDPDPGLPIEPHTGNHPRDPA